LKKQSEIAFHKAVAERDAETTKKQKYSAALTAQINGDKRTKQSRNDAGQGYEGMSHTEQSFNSRIIGKMSGQDYDYC